MKHVLIGGVSSYIGTALKMRLSALSDRFTAEAVSLRGASLDALDFHGKDAVVLVAAIVHQKERPEMAALYRAVNCDLALAAARKAKAEGVRHFVFFSTMAVYGKITGAITRDTVAEPVTLYGRSKYEAELALSVLNDETFTVSILRPPMVIGRGVKGNYRTLERLAKRLPFCPDYPNRRSLVRIDTLCDCVIGLLEQPRAGIFFPQEPEPVATRDLIDELARDNGRTLKRSKLLNPAIAVLRRTTRVGKKAFGDLLYEDLTELPLETEANK